MVKKRKANMVTLDVELRDGGGHLEKEVPLLYAEGETTNIIEKGIIEVVGDTSYYYPGHMVYRISWLTNGVKTEDDEDGEDDEGSGAHLFRDYKKPKKLTSAFK